MRNFVVCCRVLSSQIGRVLTGSPLRPMLTTHFPFKQESLLELTWQVISLNTEGFSLYQVFITSWQIQSSNTSSDNPADHGPIQLHRIYRWPNVPGEE